MLENKKNILLSIHNIDAVAYKVNNKFKYMNLQHLVQILDSMNSEQLSVCSDAIYDVEQKMSKMSDIIDDMHSEILSLIMSYDINRFDPSKHLQDLELSSENAPTDSE